jgi:hypothetical protein
MGKRLISELQAAKLLKVVHETMSNWRQKGKLDGIFEEIQYPTLKRVFYDKEALLDWAKKEQHKGKRLKSEFQAAKLLKVTHQNKSNIGYMISVLDASLPAVEKLTDSDHVYLYGRLDSIKYAIRLFCKNDKKLLTKWQELADKVSYKNYEYQ